MVKVFNKSLPLIEKFFFKINMIMAICQDKNKLQDFDAFIFALKTSKSKAKAQANKRINLIFKKELFLIRKYKFRLNLNKYKFEEKFLAKLKSLISKFYNKEIEFNIINLKSIVFNSDLFTQISTLKLKKKKSHVQNVMQFILNKAVLPTVNRVQEKARMVKNVDGKFLENKYKNIHLNFIMNQKNNYNIDDILNDLFINIKDKFSLSYPRGVKALYDIIFNSIKYKNMGGIRLEVRGRLTKRYRADRAVYKVR